MRSRAAILAAAFGVAGWVGTGSASAQDYAPPPAPPPKLCAGDAFVDVVGTPKADSLTAFTRATRVWGLGGGDRLTGSPTRAACLLGGLGNDVLELNTGGGVALGEWGRDTITGSDLGDIIRPGKNTDAVTAAGGDDKIEVRDGNAEYVACGAGADIVKADRTDILTGCESLDLAGREPLRLEPVPDRTSRTGSVRVALTVPRAAGAGAYRLLYMTGADGRACGGGPVEVARFPKPGLRVRRHQRIKIGVRRPAGGWCRGRANVVVVREPRAGVPVAGVARFAFSVR